MKCPNCHKCESRVIESRDVVSGESIRRRRECLDCNLRFTTYERLERPALAVIKKDGKRQLYDRSKLASGLQKACEKTSITGEQLDNIADTVEKTIYETADGEISSHQIGTIIMDILADINQVAYVRFASVYRNFADVESFELELERIKQRLNRETNKP